MFREGTLYVSFQVHQGLLKLLLRDGKEIMWGGHIYTCVGGCVGTSVCVGVCWVYECVSEWVAVNVWVWGCIWE